MAPCCSKESSHRFLSAALLCAIVFLSALPAIAQKSESETAKPTLVVWARTDLANQGAPTLDLLDLERYFVKELVERGVANVVPSQTARIPSPPIPNIYLLELSVEVMQRADRAIRDAKTQEVKVEYIFHVELTLTVKQKLTGRFLGRTGERREYQLRYYEREDIEAKRAAIYETAKHLADRYLDAAARNEFGADLTWHWIHQLKLSHTIFLGLFLLPIVIIAVGIVVGARHDKRAGDCARVRETHEAWDRRIEEAKAKMLETYNFSDHWIKDAARVKCDELLANAPAIERSEAERQVDWKSYETENDRVAGYASRALGLNPEEVKDMLRKTDELPYRLLQAAKAIKLEAA